MYCECFQAGILCSFNCKCEGCQNCEGVDLDYRASRRKRKRHAQEDPVSAKTFRAARRTNSSTVRRKQRCDSEDQFEARLRETSFGTRPELTPRGHAKSGRALRRKDLSGKSQSGARKAGLAAARLQDCQALGKRTLPSLEAEEEDVFFQDPNPKPSVQAKLDRLDRTEGSGGSRTLQKTPNPRSQLFSDRIDQDFGFSYRRNLFGKESDPPAEDGRRKSTRRKQPCSKNIYY